MMLEKFQMEDYYDVLTTLKILARDELRPDRTGVKTASRFGVTCRYDLTTTLPILCSKQIYFKSLLAELLWFISGSTNTKDLKHSGIWDEWADDDGNLGPIYGAQWRGKGSCKVDQLLELETNLRNDPFSRRHIIDSWNVNDLNKMALPPCHVLSQFYVDHKTGKLSCSLYQRSGDWFLGVPFNITSYALLTHMLCITTGYSPGELIHTVGDAHLYSNHVDQATELLDNLSEYECPTLLINPKVKSVVDFEMDDFKLRNYYHSGPIKAEVAV